MSQCDDKHCPSHRRFMEADTVRLLYKNRLQEVGKNLKQQEFIASSLAVSLEKLKSSIDECVSVARRLERTGDSSGGDKEATDAKQG